jgi:hypothetical protein
MQRYLIFMSSETLQFSYRAFLLDHAVNFGADQNNRFTQYEICRQRGWIDDLGHVTQAGVEEVRFAKKIIVVK